ncbi:MAG: ferrochelatase, partial [Pirellulaceae bacterium]|nr:ferrochelatase [Pirellulaceae bacterium]
TCHYVQQLREHSRLVAESVGATRWALVYQSRSGPPAQPWLEPDVNDFIREQHAAGSLTDALIAPIGFISDHVEVKFDLDTEARQTCAELGVGFQRAATAGVHPLFISMLRDLIAERVESLDSRPTIGEIGPCPDVCDTDCCPRPPARPH